MIGIICAMEEEAAEICNYLKLKEETALSYIKFKIGKILQTECCVGISSVGKVNAAVCTQAMILKYNPKIILNLGTAGALDSNLNAGDVVIAKNVIQHDYDISAFGERKRGEISGINLAQIPCDGDFLKISHECAKSLGYEACTGNVLTGDKFIDNEQESITLKKIFKGIACDMESGAIGQVCYANDVKFVAIKVISDKANEKSVVNFDKFLHDSSTTIARIVTNIIQKIPK